MDAITIRGPMFYSAGDEAAFFGWLRRIRAVAGVGKRPPDVRIELRPGRISQDELREFRALFHRYGLDTTPLEELGRR